MSVYASRSENLSLVSKGNRSSIRSTPSFVLLSAGVALAAIFVGQAALAADEPWKGPVPKATCGPGSRIESGLQGSTSLAERFSGASAQAYRCNMELVWAGTRRRHKLADGLVWQLCLLRHSKHQ